MPQPTDMQLESINKFALVPRTAENTYTFPARMIDNQRTCYNTVLQEPLLNKFLQDASDGIAVLVGHNNREIPIGRTYGANIVRDGDIISLHGDAYMDLGRNTQCGMSTDDIAKSIDAGTVFDVSIGFNASKNTCSVCGYDIRDYRNCPHIPGRTYEVENADLPDSNGNPTIQSKECVVLVGGDGIGSLNEVSLVYSGACNRASIMHNLSASESGTTDKVSNLSIVEDFKDIPLDASIYQYYTKDGSVLLTDTNENTGGAEYLRKRSEETVEMQKLLATLSKEFGVDVKDEATILSAINTLKSNLSSGGSDLTAVNAKLSAKEVEVTELTSKVAGLTEDLSAKDATIIELTAKNEGLSAQAELATAYKADLVKNALELGVRAQGNAFQAELFEKFLNTLSIDDIKSTISGFEKEVSAKYSNGRTTAPKAVKTTLDASDAPNVEDEIEFRTYVAGKATEYARENNISLKEATKLMYSKYSSEQK